MVSLDDAVIARLNRDGERFEVLVDPEEVQPFKEGKLETLTLASDFVFSGSKRSDSGEKQLIRHHASGVKGGISTEKASEDSLMKSFGTTDINEIAAQIVMKGEIHLTTEQRKKMMEEKRRLIISLLARNCINPTNKTPHPPARIELAMEEAKVNIDPFKSAEAQVSEVIKELRPILPIRIEMAQIAVKTQASHYGKLVGDIRGYGKVLKEEWTKSGEWLCLVEIPAGLQLEFFDMVNSRTHGEAETKMIN